MRKSDRVFELGKKRGIVWPAFEIYGGVKGFVEYGPIGSLIKNNVENLFRNHYVLWENCFEIQSPTLTPEEVWVASGHVENFTDFLAECTKCGEPYRADHLLEEHAGESMDGKTLGELSELIKKHGLKCPKCGGSFGKVYDYNLMFKTHIGPGKYKIAGYLRPETAQGTYVPFKRLFNVTREKLPLGVFQIGHSFRNEISPRQMMIRLREFNQAEVQFFNDPEDKNWVDLSKHKDLKVRVLTKQEQSEKKAGQQEIKIGEAVEKKLIKDPRLAYFLAVSYKLYLEMGLDEKKLRLRQQTDEERAFYSQDTWDVEYISEDFGRIELVGVADRTDYDLKRHQELSGQDMSVNIDGKKFVPHVLEVAYGVDRPVYCLLESCLREEKERVFFSLPAKIAPYKVAVFPLVRKGGLPEKAQELLKDLKKQGFYALYEEKASIGKRYARVDEIGVPFAVTVDFDTLEDDTVTLRERDSTKQERVKTGELVDEIRKRLLA